MAIVAVRSFRWLVAFSLVLGAVLVCTAGAAVPVRVTVAGKLTAPVAGRAWTMKLAVRPVSFKGAVRVTATGPRSISAKATGKQGAYRASFVFPAAGRWALTARAGGRTSRLGTVQVRPKPPPPVTFVQPTSIELEPAGTLLLVENNPGRLLRVDPATGGVTVVVPSLDHPYSVVRAPSGAIFISVGTSVQRLDAAGVPTPVATMAATIGPLAVAPNGDVYFTDGFGIYRLAGGAGPPKRIGGNVEIFQAHGLAIAADGAVLVGDTGASRIVRIDPVTDAVTTLGVVGGPRGVDVAADGSIFAVDSVTNGVDRVSSSGASLGSLGPAFLAPYDVQAIPGGGVYLLEAGPVGYIRRIAPNGKVTTVSRPAS